MSAAVEVKLQLPDVGEVTKRGQKALDILTDWGAVFETAIAPFMRRHVREVYQSNGRAAGARWSGYGNEPKYAAFKAAILFDGDPSSLPSTGGEPGGLMRWRDKGEAEERLYPSLRNRTHPDNIARVDDLRAVWGTSVPYAARLALKGGTNPFGESYGPRPILSMADQQKGRLEKRIGAHYSNALQRAGFDVDATELIG